MRKWKKGDRFQPLGMSGTKKLSDFLINLKIALPDKKNVRVIESDGEIVWVVNHRIDERFRVTNETEKVLLIRCHE
jgi:tRNA(Ile)-lysidine synthase